MKKYIWISIISLFLFQSCLGGLLYNRLQKGERDKVINAAKKSHFIGWNDVPIGKILRRVSDNKCKWGYLDDNRCNCIVNLTYAEPPTYYTKNIPMIFYFKYNSKTKYVELEKVLEVYTNRWYEKPIALNNIVQILMSVYYQQ